MKRNDVFVARLARGAVASTLAACLMPKNHTEGAPTGQVAQEATFAQQTAIPGEGTQQGTNKAVLLTMGQARGEWDRGLEREFRKLSVGEAQGTLTAEQLSRLEQLNRWRDQLLCPQPAEEILLQIKRDRLLNRMEEVLNDYVEFQEVSGKARAAT
jgi:hypothetical protein